ncbi:hypothetical protein V2J09_022815 [Rumex salicifolius]
MANYPSSFYKYHQLSIIPPTKTNTFNLYPSPPLLLYISLLGPREKNMCNTKREWKIERCHVRYDPYGKLRHQRMRRSSVQLHRLIRKRQWEKKSRMEIEEMNMKLYLKNKAIMEANKELRKKAVLLRQENIALLLQFQKKVCHEHAF